jgi:hypothetical protein
MPSQRATLELKLADPARRINLGAPKGTQRTNLKIPSCWVAELTTAVICLIPWWPVLQARSPAGPAATHNRAGRLQV